MVNKDIARIQNRRFMRVARAGRELNVDPDLIQGLIIGHKIDGFKTEGSSGHTVWMVYADQVRKLKHMMAS